MKLSQILRLKWSDTVCMCVLERVGRRTSYPLYDRFFDPEEGARGHSGDPTASPGSGGDSQGKFSG